MLTTDAKGRRAEEIASWWLRLKGYQPIARRFATPVGEIDIIVRREDLVVFVEVKTRLTEDAALFAVTPRQQRRIQRTAEWFLATRPILAQAQLRFDVIAIMPWRLPRHLPDAWRPEA